MSVSRSPIRYDSSARGRLLPALLATAAMCGCNVALEVPPGAPVECSTNGDCPLDISGVKDVLCGACMGTGQGAGPGLECGSCGGKGNV